MAAETALTPRPRSPRFTLRPIVFGVLLLTAIVSLGAAAPALLAPLRSQFRHNAIELGISTVSGATTALGVLPVDSHGIPLHRNLKLAADRLLHANGAEYVLWDDRLQRRVDTDDESNRPADFRAPEIVRAALRPTSIVTTPHTLTAGVLVVATRYRGGSDGGRSDNGRSFVLEMIRHVNYAASADSVVRAAFLYAALVGFGVAIVLGIALSSVAGRRRG